MSTDHGQTVAVAGGAVGGGGTTVEGRVTGARAPATSTPWLSPVGQAVSCCTVCLDLMAALGRHDINLDTAPAVVSEFWSRGGRDQVQAGLALVGHRLQPDPATTAAAPRSWNIVRASDGAVMDSPAALQAVADAVSIHMEPSDTDTGNGAWPHTTLSGATVWVHVEPLHAARRMCMAIAAVLRRAVPAAVGSTRPPIDLDFLRTLRICYTACDSGEDFMIPFETCFQADGAANTFSVPNVYSFRPGHRAYMLSPDTYNSRTWGRAIILAATDALSVPSHEVVHLIQHAAGQVDRGKGSWQAEHDASRCALPLLLAALEELQRHDFPATTSGEEEGRGITTPPPSFMAPLVVMHILMATVQVRCKPAFHSVGFMDKCVAAAAAPAPTSAVKPAAASTATDPPLLAMYLRWMASWGMWNPAVAMAGVGSTPYEDDVFKLMCTLDTAASMVGQARREGHVGVVDVLGVESATVRVLQACFAGRVGDVYSEASMEGLTAALEAARLNDAAGASVTVDTILELVRPAPRT